MRILGTTTHYNHHNDFGIYAEARLNRGNRTDLAEELRVVTEAVQRSGRELEDARRPVQQARARRDSAADSLDAAVKQFRCSLLGRGVDVGKTAPYTAIFPEGMRYYTNSSLGKEAARYSELKRRILEHLPESDELRAPTVAALESGLAEYSAANAVLLDAQNAEALASTRLTAAKQAFNRSVEKVYGKLVTDLGRATANRFFLRPNRRANKSEAKLS